MKKISGVKKIAVLRSNAIGDYVVCLPALHALRAAYPQAEITLLGQHWHAEFLKNRPGPIDRVEVVPCMKGIYAKGGADPDSPEAVENFFGRMVKEEFDLAVQLYGGGRYSNPFVKRLGAGCAIGMKSPDAETLDRWVPYVFYHYEVLRYLEVVALAGAKPVELEPKIPVLKEDIFEALPFLPQAPFAILHPGASDPRRRWPAEKFAAVGDALKKQGVQVMITGSREERPIARTVRGLMKTEALNRAGDFSLKGLIAALRKASLVVSNDTGPLHLARATGTPTVGIYWIGNALNASPLSVTRNRTHISWRLNCPVCGNNCIQSDCPHKDSFVADVRREDVIHSALQSLRMFT
ncbi:MAG: glycosyltransferase family 9 protein [Candidatus Omnitrophota bacterium]